MSRTWEPSELLSGFIRQHGFRRCYRRKTVFHGVENSCDCLRTELPLECQALSSGALGTPHRGATRGDAAARSRLTAARAAGRIGRRG